MATYNPRDFVPQFGYIAQAGQQIGQAIGQIPVVAEALKTQRSNDEYFQGVDEQANKFDDAVFQAAGLDRQQFLSSLTPAQDETNAAYLQRVQSAFQPLVQAQTQVAGRQEAQRFAQAQLQPSATLTPASPLAQPREIGPQTEQQAALGGRAFEQTPRTELDVRRASLGLSQEALATGLPDAAAKLLGAEEKQAGGIAGQAKEEVTAARKNIDTLVNQIGPNNIAVMEVRVPNEARRVKNQFNEQAKSLQKLNDAIVDKNFDKVTELAIKAGIAPSQATDDVVSQALISANAKVADWENQEAELKAALEEQKLIIKAQEDAKAEARKTARPTAPSKPDVAEARLRTSVNQTLNRIFSQEVVLDPLTSLPIGYKAGSKAALISGSPELRNAIAHTFFAEQARAANVPNPSAADIARLRGMLPQQTAPQESANPAGLNLPTPGR